MSTQGFAVMGDGARIAWRADGDPTLPPLLLSNSLGTDWSMWEPQMAAFSREYRVVRYDGRGHGRSDAPGGAYSIDRLGRDVVELLDQLDIGRVRFCGVSLGGMVGQWLGVRAPQRIDRLALCNTSAYMGPPANWDARIRQVRDHGLAELAAASAQRWFTPAFRAHGAEAVAAIEATLCGLDPVGYAGTCAAIRDMDLRPFAHLVEPPTLVLGGALDPASPPADSDWLAEHIASAAQVMLPAAHLSNVELPGTFNEAVLGFLRGRSVGRETRDGEPDRFA